MYSRSGTVTPEGARPREYVRLKEQVDEKFELFMIKYLQRNWPLRFILIIGLLQLAISVSIFSVDIIVILMFAPRWQVLVACWTFLATFASSVATLHTIRQSTWDKLKWAVAFNIIGGLAVALMLAFDILILVNPKICLVSDGCKYYAYTYSRSSSFLAGEVVLGIAFYISVVVFLVLFIKYGIGGLKIFEDIRNEWIPTDQDPQFASVGRQPAAMAPKVGSGVRVAPNYPPTVQPQPRYPGPYPPQMRYPGQPVSAKPPQFAPPGMVPSARPPTPR